MKTPAPWLCLLLATSIASFVDGANILALLVIPSRSHHIWNRVLVDALASRGHHVTVLSPDAYPNPGPNVTHFLIEDAYMPDESVSFEGMAELSTVDGIVNVFEFGKLMCKHGMATEGVRRLIAQDTVFDLVIHEMTVLECYWGIAHKFGSPPTVAVTAWSSPIWADGMIGNPGLPSYMPSFHLPYTDRMDFWQRALNALVVVGSSLYRQNVHLPAMDAMSRQLLGPTTPSIADIERNVSVVLVNTQIGVDHPRAMLPAMVEVGGLHLQSAKPLPKDLQKWMDDATEGVIFFSLGTNVRSDQLTPAKISTLLTAFGRLRQRVLWKFESPHMPGKPDNVRIEKWLPQRDILGHPHALLFISHCGLLSSQEATYFGVPIVGIPFFADQFTNLAKMVDKGVAEGLDYNTLNAEEIFDTLTRVIDTPSYRTNMRELSMQFRDLPQHPLQVAVFWIEYVIRHKGAHHLKAATMSLNWVQLYLIDVVGAFALALAVSLWAIYLIFKRAFSMCKPTPVSRKQKRK